MDKYNVERRGRAGESNKQGGFSFCVRGDRKKKNKTKNPPRALVPCHTLASPVLDRSSHMSNITVCFEIAPRRLCSLLTRLTFTTSGWLCLVFFSSRVWTLSGYSVKLVFPLSKYKSIFALKCLLRGVGCRHSRTHRRDDTSALWQRISRTHRHCFQTWYYYEVTATCDKCSQVSFEFK